MKWPDICSMLGARCWHARQYRPSSDVMGFRLRGASALSGTMAGPVARSSRRSSGRRLASRVRVRSSSPPSGQTARVSRDPMEASVRQRARVAAAHSSGWKGKVMRSESFTALHLQRSRVLASRFGARSGFGILRAAGWRCGVHDLGLDRLLEGGLDELGINRDHSRAVGAIGCLSLGFRPRGTCRVLGGPTGSGAASEACWRAEATASKENPSLGVAPTSSGSGSC